MLYHFICLVQTHFCFVCMIILYISITSSVVHGSIMICYILLSAYGLQQWVPTSWSVMLVCSRVLPYTGPSLMGPLDHGLCLWVPGILRQVIPPSPMGVRYYFRLSMQSNLPICGIEFAGTLIKS